MHTFAMEKSDITLAVAGVGKLGHGLCGKNGDLDFGGQIKVGNATLFNFPDENMLKCWVELSVYANICPPYDADENELDIATEIITDLSAGYPGEWSGECWTISMGGVYTAIYDLQPLPINNTCLQNINKNFYAEQVVRKIFDDQQIRGFQQVTEAINRAIKAIK